jgi:hypothetical protein
MEEKSKALAPPSNNQKSLQKNKLAKWGLDTATVYSSSACALLPKLQLLAKVSGHLFLSRRLSSRSISPGFEKTRRQLGRWQRLDLLQNLPGEVQDSL